MVRHRRRIPALAVGLVVVACALASCASGPTDADRAAWDDWASTIVDASDGAALSGSFEGAWDAEPVTLDLATPEAFGSVELRCIGTERASFTVSYVGEGTSDAEQDIVCQDGAPRTPIAIPTGVGVLTSMSVHATSSNGLGTWTAQLRP
ncbi:MAG TPA: hypothetical protein VEP72_05070 [Microbacterium sp.]|nr:hypothetical protein [Microbacterium sp.]